MNAKPDSNVEINVVYIAKELNRRYNEKKDVLKKGQKSQFFNMILKSLYSDYGEYLGYSNLSDFKSSIVRARNGFNQGLKIPLKNIINQPDYMPPRRREIERIPSEGDGIEFTRYQVDLYDLKEDSYF